jgi:type I restriction enzyme S subunit
MKEGSELQHEMPHGWRQTIVGEALQIIDYRGRTPPFSSSGIPHLRSSNIKGGRIVWKNLAYVTGQTYDAYMTRGLPQEGDVLFTTEAPLGEVALVPKEKFSVAQRMMILRPKPELLKSRFLMVQLMSPQFHAKLRHRGTGSTVTGVSSRNFQPLPLLIPPLAEQEGIAAEVERRLSVIEELEAAVQANLTRADRLRQSVLATAFSGTLGRL